MRSRAADRADAEVRVDEVVKLLTAETDETRAALAELDKAYSRQITLLEEIAELERKLALSERIRLHDKQQLETIRGLYDALSASPLGRSQRKYWQLRKSLRGGGNSK